MIAKEKVDMPISDRYSLVSKAQKSARTFCRKRSFPHSGTHDKLIRQLTVFFRSVSVLGNNTRVTKGSPPVDRRNW